MVSGFEVIKSFNVEKHSMNKFSTINNEVEETSFKTNSQAIVFPLQTPIIDLAPYTY